MLKLLDTERPYLASSCALVINEEGHECLAGLTVAESNFFLEFHRGGYPAASADSAELFLYLNLFRIHEAARLVLAAHARLQGKDVPAKRMPRVK